MAGDVFDQEQFNIEWKKMRLKYLEEQAMYALKISCKNYSNAVFPNAMVAGDIVITHLLSRLRYFEWWNMHDYVRVHLSSISRDHGIPQE